MHFFTVRKRVRIILRVRFLINSSTLRLKYEMLNLKYKNNQTLKVYSEVKIIFPRLYHLTDVKIRIHFNISHNTFSHN